jgi:hypothetical protein
LRSQPIVTDQLSRSKHKSADRDRRGDHDVLVQGKRTLRNAVGMSAFCQTGGDERPLKIGGQSYSVRKTKMQPRPSYLRPKK